MNPIPTPTAAGPSMERAASKCAPPGMDSSALRGAEDASLFNPKISWMPKPVHLGACDVMLFDKCGLLFPPFSANLGLFKLSDNTAPSFPVMVPLRIVPVSLVHRNPPVQIHAIPPEILLLSKRSIPTRARSRQPITCEQDAHNFIESPALSTHLIFLSK